MMIPRIRTGCSDRAAVHPWIILATKISDLGPDVPEFCSLPD